MMNRLTRDKSGMNYLGKKSAEPNWGQYQKQTHRGPFYNIKVRFEPGPLILNGKLSMSNLNLGTSRALCL